MRYKRSRQLFPTIFRIYHHIDHSLWLGSIKVENVRKRNYQPEPGLGVELYVTLSYVTHSPENLEACDYDTTHGQPNMLIAEPGMSVK